MGDRIIVVGAGVVGLTSAVKLAEAGHEVQVFARDLPLETTSAAAGALWYPYHAWPADRVNAWSILSYEKFGMIAKDNPDAGVRVRWGTERVDGRTKRPGWADHIPVFEDLGDKWRFAAPVIDMGIYLPWLVSRLEELGGSVTRHALSDLPTGAGIVVNACGLAARRLAQDESVHPVRGQVVVVEQFGLEEWSLDDVSGEGPTYVIPRINEVVVGGTSEEGNWSRRPDPATAERLLHDATNLVPELADVKVLRHKVGLRPARPAVRLEKETMGGRTVVHCYGHGGSGVTMSWGCADEVAGIIAGL